MNRFFTLLFAASCLTAVGQEPLEIIYSNDSTSFFFETNPATWQEAQDFAIAYGGHLATFSDSAENFAILAILPVNPEGYWFGLNQVGDGAEPDGGWGWVTSEDLSFTGWSLGEPNDSDSGNQGEDEDCGEIFENGWNDQYCHELNQFIVEIPNFKLGCTEESACNYKVDAFIDDGSCHFNCQFCHDGTEWDEDLFKCIVANPADINFDGCVQLNDLLDLLSAYGDCGAEESAWQCGDPLEYQGYDYETVQIGEQCWFAENLRAENYRNGDVISCNLDDSEWASTSDGAVTHYNLELDNIQNFGKLFNWYAASDARGLCPPGWSVPSENEWQTLEIEIGVPLDELNLIGLRGTDQGTQLKAQSDLWNSDLGLEGTDIWGYHGLPGGERVNEGFIHLGNYGFWWTTTLNDDGDKAFFRELTFNHPEIYRHNGLLNNGMSIRCIKDTE